MHLVLVADAAPWDRQVLRKILVRDLGCRVVEATTGLEAAALVESEKPDAIVLDLDLPQMNGFELIECVRSAGGYRRMPVIVATHVNDAQIVHRLASLGIADLLAKPVNHERYRARFKRALSTVPARAGRDLAADFEVSTSEVIVLVDKDPNFRAFVTPLLNNSYKVVETASGVTGLQAISNSHPFAVLVGPDLPFINERVFVRTARGLPTQTTPGIFYLTQKAEVPPDLVSEFDGIIQKSFVPDQFMAEFRRVVLRQEPARDILVSIVTNDMRPEIITAVQQTIGVLSNQTVLEMAPEQLAEVRPDLWAKAELSNEDAVFSICMGGANSDLKSLATTIVGSGEDNDVADVLQETVNTMVGRIRASLGERGIMMEQAATVVSADDYTVSADRGIAVPFTTESGTRFVMSLMVEEKTANV